MDPIPAEGGRGAESIMVAPWPVADPGVIDESAEAEMALVKEVVTAARTVRSELGVPPGKKVKVAISAADQERARALLSAVPYVEILASAEEVDVGVRLRQPPLTGCAVVGDLEIYVRLDGVIDVAAERARLGKETDKFRSLCAALEKKLGNKGFLEKAPREVVERERQRLAKYTVNRQKLEASLEMLAS